MRWIEEHLASARRGQAYTMIAQDGEDEDCDEDEDEGGEAEEGFTTEIDTPSYKEMFELVDGVEEKEQALGD